MLKLKNQSQPSIVAKRLKHIDALFLSVKFKRASSGTDPHSYFVYLNCFEETIEDSCHSCLTLQSIQDQAVFANAHPLVEIGNEDFQFEKEVKIMSQELRSD